MRYRPVDVAIGRSDQNDGAGPCGQRRRGCVGRVGKRAGRSGPPEPAGGWTPTAGPETRTGPDRGRAARRRPAGGSRRRRGRLAAFEVIRRLLGPNRPFGYEDGPHKRLQNSSEPDILAMCRSSTSR